MRREWMGWAALCCLLLCCPAAWAVLGGKAETVAADQAKLQAQRSVSVRARYQVHELAVGTSRLREFVSPEGVVFGVAWTAAARPPYDTLLGGYASRLNDAARQRHDHHAPLSIVEPDFVFSAFGHMRFYGGRAWVPGLVPSGVTAEEEIR